MMQNTRLTLILLVLTMIAPMMGCGIDTNPFPSSSDDSLESPSDMGSDSANGGTPDAEGDAGENTGGTDAGNTETDTSACDMDEQGREPYTIFHANGRKLLVGDVQSVTSESRVDVLDSTGAQVAQTNAAQDGSFALETQESLPTMILVQSSVDDIATSEVNVGLTDATTAAYTGSQLINDAWVDGGFTDDSGFTIEQAGDTLELSASSQTLLPGLSVVLANLTDGLAMVERVNNDGSFSVWVQAESGDTIVIFAVEHGSSNGGGQPLTIEVP